jgi:hypothetical protein
LLPWSQQFGGFVQSLDSIAIAGMALAVCVN